jgi:hypothetical protein
MKARITYKERNGTMRLTKAFFMLPLLLPIAIAAGMLDEAMISSLSE